MKNKYLAPRQRVVELNEFEMLCTSGEDDNVQPTNIELDDYDTYGGNDTGSDF